MGYPSVYPTGATLYDPSRAWSGYTFPGHRTRRGAGGYERPRGARMA